MSDEREVLKGYEKAGLIFIIIVLAAARIFDARPLAPDQVSLTEYLSSAGDVTVTAVEIYFLLRINAIIERFLRLLAFVFRQQGWTVRFTEPSGEEEKAPTSTSTSTFEIAILRALYERDRERWRTVGIVSFAISGVVFLAWMYAIHRPPIVASTPSPVVQHVTPVTPPASNTPPVQCGPTNCSESNSQWSCALPHGSSPSAIAAALYGSQRRGIEIWHNNASRFPGLTDRQIPTGARLIVPDRPAACGS